ncbi:PREDICTED: probable mediator of RNA polymerase II transcription subunit 26b isoform X3 [Ipomoea nil]|nr:PREDICTED: probable mediator of RNA polymerase II transcription subunit 26b isoform X3 [Ipomoea nil]XP_019162679.1 PREDICTED: probable mediator of RNA polymerase II transcription subunit 26b isoform X3 [Ipomoea nil]
MVAAMDCPKEFKLRRDRIAEMLFTCKATRCSGCNNVELALPNEDEVKEKRKNTGFAREFENGVSKESKTCDSRDDRAEMNVKQVSNYSYGDAEALTDEIEEESLTVREVLRIKGILDNYEEESDSILFDSLRRLQLMDLSVETLKATEIGKSVNGLRKHGSKQIKHLVRTLIEDWKVMVDEWVQATAAITESTPESVKASVVEDEEEEEEEEGLPSPPLDEGAFFTTASMELSQFFDGMDFDGNPRNSGEFNKNHENGRKPSVENHNVPVRKPQFNERPNVAPRNIKNEPPKKQEVVMKKQETDSKLNKPSAGDFGPGRPTRPAVEQKFQQKPDKSKLQKRPVVSNQNKLKTSDEDSVQVKLEAAKRKLQERYQEAANAKKQRTIQVMELQDIPKQGQVHKNPHGRPGNNRHWANGRR